MIKPEIAQAIINEFDGNNQRIANAVQLFHLNEETGQQVLWAGQATQLDHLHGLRAALQALEKAADLDSSGRALVVIAYLPEAPVRDPGDDRQVTSPANLGESQSNSRHHDCKETNQSTSFQSDLAEHPDTSLLNPPIEPLTPEQVRRRFAFYGVPLTEFCRTHRIRYKILLNLIMGRNENLSGASGRAAMILGMKLDPKTKKINNPFAGLDPLSYKRDFLV